MASGGARNRSGPAVDPKSGRSDARKLTFTDLPSEGNQGEAPKFPLLPRTVRRWEFEDKAKFQVVDREATEMVRDRESELWDWAWVTPQAVAWAKEPWRWQAIAQWVRISVLCETDEATSSDRSSVHRYADQIGMTPAGLRENGWQIVADEVAAARTEKAPKKAAPKRRLRAVNGGGD